MSAGQNIDVTCATTCWQITIVSGCFGVISVSITPSASGQYFNLVTTLVNFFTFRTCQQGQWVFLTLEKGKQQIRDKYESWLSLIILTMFRSEQNLNFTTKLVSFPGFLRYLISCCKQTAQLCNFWIQTTNCYTATKTIYVLLMMTAAC